MSFRGDISSIALGDVVQNLVINRKTGILAIDSEDLEFRIQFEDGDIVAAADGRGIDVGAWLASKELISEEDLKAARKKLRRARKRRSLGEKLDKVGAMSLDEYSGHLSTLVSDSLCEAFTLSAGGFEFREGEVDPELAGSEMRFLGLRFSAQNLVMEAARRSDDWNHIRRHIPAECEIWFASPDEREAIAASAEDDVTPQALEWLDGSHSIGQVIANLPCSRFEALHCLADLVAQRRIRPVDSHVVVESSDRADDPHEAIARLKSLLEREPGNRQVLEKLAGLCESHGVPEEAAKYHKVLANGYLEEGDSDSAQHHLRRTVELNPQDILAWQRLWDCVAAVGDDARVLAFGREYLKHFEELGLTEVVRDHLQALIRRFPAEVDFKVQLAEACFALGDRKAGVQGLFDAGHEFLRRRRYDEAEEAFRTILRYDRENERARKICGEIQSGRLERRRRARRRVLREAAVCALIVAGVWAVVREVHAQSQLFAEMRRIVAEPIAERGQWSEARRRLEAFQERHGATFTSAGHADAILDAIRHKAGPQGPPAQGEAEGERSGEGASGKGRASRQHRDEEALPPSAVPGEGQWRQSPQRP